MAGLRFAFRSEFSGVEAICSLCGPVSALILDDGRFVCQKCRSAESESEMSYGAGHENVDQHMEKGRCLATAVRVWAGVPSEANERAMLSALERYEAVDLLAT